MRKMIQANEAVFTKLYEFMKRRDPNLEVQLGPRHIKTTGQERNQLKQLVIKDKQRITGNGLVATLSSQGNKYVVFVGWGEPDPVEEYVLMPSELDAGIGTALISELPIPVRPDAEPLEVVQTVLYQVDADDDIPDNLGNWEYEFRDIMRFFLPMSLYRIPDNSPLLDLELSRITGYYLCQNKGQLILPFGDDTIEYFKQTFLEIGSRIPYENLLVALTSVYWKHAFLDLYRCLERLFPMCLVRSLHRSTGTSLSLLSFAMEIENSIKWKPKEIEALQELIDESEIPQLARQLLGEVKKDIWGDGSGKLANSLYKIRNTTVHHRTNGDSERPEDDDDENWRKLVTSLLLIVQDKYKEYSPYLAPESTTSSGPTSQNDGISNMTLEEPEGLLGSLWRLLCRTSRSLFQIALLPGILLLTSA